MIKEHKKGITLWPKSELYGYISPFFSDLQLPEKNFSQKELKESLEEQLDHLQRLISLQNIFNIQNYLRQMFRFAYRLQAQERFEKMAERIIEKILKTVQDESESEPTFYLKSMVAQVYHYLGKLNINRVRRKRQAYQKKCTQIVAQRSKLVIYDEQNFFSFQTVEQSYKKFSSQNQQQKLSFLSKVVGYSQPKLLYNKSQFMKVMWAGYGSALAKNVQQKQGIKLLEKSYVLAAPEDTIYLNITKKLALLYFSNEQFEKSTKFYKQYLKALQISLYPLDHLQVGLVYYSLGRIYKKTDQYAQAVHAFHTCLKIFKSKLRVNPNVLLQSYVWAAQVSEKLKDYKQAKVYLQQGICWCLDKNIEKQLDCKEAYLDYFINYSQCFQVCLGGLLQLSQLLNDFQFLLGINQKISNYFSFHLHLLKQFHLLSQKCNLVTAKLFFEILATNLAINHLQFKKLQGHLLERQNKHVFFNQNAKLLYRGIYSAHIYFQTNYIETSKWLKQRPHISIVIQILKQQSKKKGSRKRLNTLSSIQYSLLLSQTEINKLKSKKMTKIKNKKVRQMMLGKLENNQPKKYARMNRVQPSEKKEQKKNAKGRIKLIENRHK